MKNLFFLLPFVVLATSAIAQEATTQSQPTSQPTQPPESQPTSPTTQPSATPASVPTVQSTPLKMVLFFLESARAANDDPARMDDAKSCLNFSTLDPVIVQESGAEYVANLAKILERLQQENIVDISKLPDTPVVETPPTIGRDPLLLNLQRSNKDDLRIWQFAPTSVERVPDLVADLDSLIEKAKTQDTQQKPLSAAEQAVSARTGSPFALVQFFFLKFSEAQDNPAVYADALACMDFSLYEWNKQKIQQNGPQLVKMLYDILLQKTSPDFRSKLPKDSIPDGKESWPLVTDTAGIVVNVARQADGQWKFASQTVKDIEKMHAVLERLNAEQKAAEPDKTKITETTTEIPFDNNSAAATLNTFLRAMAAGDVRTAVDCLDLSALTDAEKKYAPVLAGKIYLTLNRVELIIPANYLEKKSSFSFIDSVDGRIALAPKKSGDRVGEWLFTAKTVRQIDKLYDKWEQKPVIVELRDRKRRLPFIKFPSLYVREYLVPDALKDQKYGLQIWQWYGLIAIAIMATAVRYTSGAIFPPIVRRLLSTKDFAILPRTARRQLRPTLWLLTLATIWVGLAMLDFGTTVTGTIWSITRVVLAIVAVIAAYRLIDLLGLNLHAWSMKTNSRLDDLLVPLLQKTAKVLAVAIGSILVVNAIGFNVTPLLAGLGLGGLAFGLAAQDTLKNFFGSVNVILDRPFQVGDYVKFGAVEGTVESVGLRSSKVRTFYQSQITVPNSELMNANIDNWGRRKYRLLRTKIGVIYATTPEQLEAFCEGIRELVRLHPNTRKDAMDIWVNEFGDSSINVILNVFFESPDWSAELQARHHFAISIMRLAKRLGVEFAFPTQTIHLEKGDSASNEPPPGRVQIPTDASGAGAVARSAVDEILNEFPFPKPTEPAKDAPNA